MQIWKDNGEKILFSFTNKEDFVLVDGVIRLSHSVLFFLSTGHELLHFGKLFEGRNVMELILLTWTFFMVTHQKEFWQKLQKRPEWIVDWMTNQPLTKWSITKQFRGLRCCDKIWNSLMSEKICHVIFFWINKMLG